MRNSFHSLVCNMFSIVQLVQFSGIVVILTSTTKVYGEGRVEKILIPSFHCLVCVLLNFVVVLFLFFSCCWVFLFCICHQLSSFVDLLLRVRVYRTNQSRFAYTFCLEPTTTTTTNRIQLFNLSTTIVNAPKTSSKSIYINVEIASDLFLTLNQ